jgi:4,5-DOPA dioxygenase extradiol
MTTMPAAFIGHGNPMNTLLQNRYTEAWRTFGATIERPRAILAISAHWYINASAVTAMERPRTIHDFFGFPDELFAYQYPAPGSTELAARVAEAAQPMWVGSDVDSWGLDHGTWSVLAHMFPEADIPVVQLSVDAGKPLDHHVALGARLAPLRDEGVLVIASGNVVHHLGEVVWGMDEQGFDWAQRFDDDAAELMRTAPGDITRLAGHADYAHAVPTPDHFLPLLYIAGLAAADDSPVDVMLSGCTLGSLSMTSYTVGSPAA